MTRSPAAEASRPTGQPLSRQDQPLRDLMLAARRQRGLLLSAENVGGSEPRTLYLHVADGTTIVKSRGASAAI